MVCPSCRTENPDGARYCIACGTALEETRSFEGERKYATVLFADVVGSTALAEGVDPETWAEVMNGAFAFMNAAVARYGGTVGRLMGDAVLAFFGAPVAQEDHAERAVWAALQLQDAARAYGERLARTQGIDFRVRVGIASGLVVFALVGDKAKTEYTAMGDAANLAARLQTAARPGSILVASETHGLVQHRFEAEARGAIEVKGKSKPVSAYEIVAPRAGAEAHAAAPGPAAPIIGREPELARLEAALDAAEAGRGAAALVVGEAGVGKSRLVAELRTRTAQRRPSWRWWEGHALSYGQSLSYHPWRALLAPALGVSPDAGPAAARAALAAAAEPLGLGPAEVGALEALLLVENASAAGDSDVLAGEDVVEQLSEAVRSVLRASARETPLVLVLEDLHWADTASLQLLERVADLTRTSPLVLLVLSRPESRERSGGVATRLRTALRDDLVVIPLAPLAGQDADRLLGSLVAAESLPARLREAILRKSDGNPFFLEEVVRSLIDAGHLVRDGTSWSATGDAAEVEIPDTLLGVLSARLDGLPAQAKRVAQTAAVIGRTFPREVLAEVCLEAPEPERIDPVDPHLGTLTSEDIVRQLPASALEYSFKHALSQDAAYDSLLMRRRRELHRRTAAVLERAKGEGNGEISAQLAYHYLRGELWAEGARYALLAAQRARRLYALDDAFGYAAAAVDALERLERPDPRSYGEAVVAWTDLAVARRLHENPRERKAIFERLERAQSVARSLDGTELLAELLVAHANVLSLSGFPALAYPLLLEANELDVAGGGDQLALLSHFQASELLVAQDPRRAVEQSEQVVALARRDRNRGFEAHALAIKALGHARLGEYRQARDTIEQALELAPTSGSTIKEADVRMVAGLVFYELGELDRGLEYGTGGLELALSIQGQQCACAAYFVAGHGQLNAMRIPEAVQAFLSSRNLGEQTRGMEMYTNLATAGNAQADLLRGRREAASEIEAAARNAAQLGDDFGAGYLTLELAEFELREGRAERALEVLEPALEYFRRTGTRPYLARALRVRADATEQLGREEEAKAARSEADELRRELDAALEESKRPPSPPASGQDGAGADSRA